MDQERTELVAALRAQAGMMMEDVSLAAVTLRGCSAEAVGEVLAGLDAEVAAMARLIAAARVLHARLSPTADPG